MAIPLSQIWAIVSYFPFGLVVSHLKNHLLNFMGTKVFVEYKGIDINYYGYEDIKLISLMWFDKFIIGFKKNIEKFDFSKKNINEYIDDIELICFLHNDYGYAKLLISEEANIF